MFLFCCVFRTALILGCEYACKDAVEVLLRNGADVTATDGFSHDSYHYARLSKNQELVAVVKSYLDSANKGRLAGRQVGRQAGMLGPMHCYVHVHMTVCLCVYIALNGLLCLAPCVVFICT